MQLQSAPHGCGPAAIANALEALGRRTAQEAVAALARTDSDGTTPTGMRRAITLLGFAPESFTARRAADAWQMLCGSLLLGRPVVLLVDDDDHWITAIGLLGPIALLIDPADGGVVQSLDHAALAARWSPPRRRPSFYGIAIRPRP